MAKVTLGSLERSAPMLIPGKNFKESTYSFANKSAPNKYYGADDFFVGSPRNGLSLEQSKKCEMLFLDPPGDHLLDEQKDSADSKLTGESSSEDQ